jgi:hypothetical protein
MGCCTEGVYCFTSQHGPPYIMEISLSGQLFMHGWRMGGAAPQPTSHPPLIRNVLRGSVTYQLQERVPMTGPVRCMFSPTLKLVCSRTRCRCRCMYQQYGMKQKGIDVTLDHTECVNWWYQKILKLRRDFGGDLYRESKAMCTGNWRIFAQGIKGNVYREL